jgi:hypothetical protein
MNAGKLFLFAMAFSMMTLISRPFTSHQPTTVTK